jgi:hypothetical protein
MTQSFRAEFPDFPAEAFPALPPTFVDTSWHNDACPSMTSDAVGISVFVDYPDPDQREFPDTKRFTVTSQEAGVEVSGPFLDTDSWDEVLAFIAARAKERAHA